MASPNSTLPTDLFFQILCYSDPRDISQWKTVSKEFNAITHEMILWRALYKNAPFPRPPGPLSTQSVPSLERTLLKAAQLAESWTTRPMRALSSLSIKVGSTDYKLPKLLFGRWFVVFESDKRFVLYDADLVAGKHTRRVLWEQETSQVSEWDLKSVVSPEGHCMMYVLLKLRRGSPGWKLLEIRLNSDTGELLHSATIDPPHDGSDISFRVSYAGNSQLLFLPASTKYHMVLDTRSHTFHKVPLSTKARLTHSRLDWIMLSDTMLISFCRSGHETNIYAFALLDGAAGETSQRTLCLTHEGIIDTQFSRIKFMKPEIDPTTGATSIKFLDYSMNLEPLELVCVAMTLPKCFPGVVLPIDIKTRDIELPQERVRLSRYDSCCKYIDISDDGQIRGFFRADKQAPSRPWEKDENQLIMKFTIDTTKDPWVTTHSQIAPAEWSHEIDPSSDIEGTDIAFDGMRGRLCYFDFDDPDILIVADIE